MPRPTAAADGGKKRRPAGDAAAPASAPAPPADAARRAAKQPRRAGGPGAGASARPPPSAREMAEAEELEEYLFGGGEAALDAFGAEADANAAVAEGRADADDYDSIAALVRSAVRSRAAGPAEDDEAGPRGGHAGGRTGGRRAPAWVDAEEAAVEVNVADTNRLRKLRQAEDESTLRAAEYGQRLRQQHSQLNPNTKWAALKPAERAALEPAATGGKQGRVTGRRRSGDESDKEDDENADGGSADGLASILRSSAPLARAGGSGPRVPAGTIELTRLRDANGAEPAASAVRSVQFHRNGQLFLAAGMDKMLRFFQIDGAKNPKLQGVYLADLPIGRAAFSADGAAVIAAGRRPFFYRYDLRGGRVERIANLAGVGEKSLESFVESPALAGPSAGLLSFLGDAGALHLVSLASRQVIGRLKVNGSVRAVTFTPDGRSLLAGGGDGRISEFDLRMPRACVACSVDEGAATVAALACAGDGSHIASGADSGVVNVYGRPGPGAPLPPTPKPAKALMHLTTCADSLAFSPDSQLLALASRFKKDALRLAHTGTLTVFQNWPTGRSPLQYVHSLAFSPGGGMLAVGNARGQALLYRLHAYDAA